MNAAQGFELVIAEPLKCPVQVNLTVINHCLEVSCLSLDFMAFVDRQFLSANLEIVFTVFRDQHQMFMQIFREFLNLKEENRFVE